MCVCVFLSVCLHVRAKSFLLKSLQSMPSNQPPLLPRPPLSAPPVYLEVPIHNLGRVQVVQRRDDLGAVEARALLGEHPLSGQMEKQLREKGGG